MKNYYPLTGYSEHRCVLVKKYRALFHYVWLLDDVGKRFKVNVGKALYDRVQVGEKLTLGRIGNKLENIRMGFCNSSYEYTIPTKYTTEDVVKAHEYCFHNKEDLKQKQKCGCFYCLRIFQSDEIVNYIADEPYGTAVCPYCSIDSVIGESSGYPIETDFLNCMNEYWF